MRRLVTLAAAVMLLLGACGGGDGGADLNGDDQAQADAIATAMLAGAGGDAVIGATEAACFGESVVREMGTSRLEELGLGVEDLAAGATPDSVDMNDADIEAMTTAMIDCVDYRSAIVNELVAGGMTQDSAQCIADGIDDDLLVQLAKSSVSEGASSALDEEMTTAMFGLMAECIGVGFEGG
jgi:hypothetical protein